MKTFSTYLFHSFLMKTPTNNFIHFDKETISTLLHSFLLETYNLLSYIFDSFPKVGLTTHLRKATFILT